MLNAQILPSTLRLAASVLLIAPFGLCEGQRPIMLGLDEVQSMLAFKPSDREILSRDRGVRVTPGQMEVKLKTHIANAELGEVNVVLIGKPFVLIVLGSSDEPIEAWTIHRFTNPRNGSRRVEVKAVGSAFEIGSSISSPFSGYVIPKSFDLLGYAKTMSGSKDDNPGD